MKFEVFSEFFFADTVVDSLSLVRVAQHLREANAEGMTRANNARVNQVNRPARVQFGRLVPHLRYTLKRSHYVFSRRSPSTYWWIKPEISAW